jgi:lambda family phage tail tape measure protein
MMPNRFNTANIAAQFQDVGVTAAMGMNPLTIALQQGTQLSAIINSMERPLAGIAAAFTSIINPVSLLAIGFVALTASLIQMTDWIAVGKSVLTGLASAVEYVAPALGYLAGALTVATAAWVAYSAVVAVINWQSTVAGIVSVATSFYKLASSVAIAAASMASSWLVAMGPIGWVTAGIIAVTGLVAVFNKSLSGIMGMDVLQAIKTGINKAVGFFFGLFEGVWAMAQEFLKKMKGQSQQTLGEAFSGAFDGALERDYVGIIKDAAGKAGAALRGAASNLGVKSDEKKGGGKTEAERYEDIVRGAERRISTLESEQRAIGATVFETARLKYETELLNDAQQKNITLSDAQKKQLGDLATQMATLEEQNKKMTESLNFTKDTIKSIFSDMRSSLRQGESLWDAFGKTALRVLDSITDRILNDLLDAIIKPSAAGAAGGGGGGILSSIGAFFGSFFAKGAAFDGGVQAFANGGAFTNGVYSSPTMFAFANGSQFGVMGEAGAEAVMPLHRGPDGSLGIRADGGAAGGAPTVNVEVIVNGNADVQQQRQTMSDGSELRRFIISTVNEANAAGDFDSSNSGRYNIAPRKVIR